ncbi:retrotransposable element Tf2 155 kDa protein type 3 [Elysia marginata]|uniref:Retrotransposable element Tf2 155 kDa protein type 3 n=1 Tax=Elysia marginata TaxID=1093978 RepID=A0AAV4ITH7_9GAST|nr:retrotransposable element Tf2 155 kDa protein type 3 [Elysia marginata]
MHSIQPPAPQFHGKQTSYVPSTLATAKYVYLRKDSHKHPLQRPYDGPFRVVSKSDKYFTLEIKGRPETVSIDRLKTAYVTPLTTEENKEVLISPKSILTDNPEPNAVTHTAVSPPKDGLIKTTRACVPSRFC